MTGNKKITISQAIISSFVISDRKHETFAECSILFKYKARTNFNHRHTNSIPRIKIYSQRCNWANLRVLVSPYLELLKIHLCLYIGFSAVFGHVMASQSFSSEALFFGFFVFILACGSAVINNIQDRNYDVFFPRTCNRSLPQKKIPLFHAKIIAILLIICGLSGLLLAKTLYPIFFGIISIILYNGVYTPLKKRSLTAIIPGSLVGMLAPMIGWSAAGKEIIDPNILIILSVFGLWQIPHFFMVILKTRDKHPDYYKSSRFPSFTHIFSKNEIILQSLIWTTLYTLSIMLFLINGSIQTQILSTLCGLNAVLIIFVISTILFLNKKQYYTFAFVAINLSMLLFMGIGIYDKCVL
jgi:heme o synthase